jgi:hypothetical protein
MCCRGIPGGFQPVSDSHRADDAAEVRELFYNLRRAMILYSIGHSNAEISAFLGLLTRYRIELLIDTRSQPYSRYAP